jgi:hypothetical protein
MIMFEVNYLAVLVGGIITMALGAFWYSPAGFGTLWQKLSGVTDEKIAQAKQGGMGKLYAANFVAALVMAFVLAHVVVAFEATTVPQGMQAGFWIWLGFIATTMLGTVLWDGKPFKLYAINAGYYFVSLLIVGSLLAVWR